MDAAGGVHVVRSIGLVEGDDLGAEEVLSSSEVGDSDRDMALVGNEEVGSLCMRVSQDICQDESQCVPSRSCRPG